LEHMFFYSADCCLYYLDRCWHCHRGDQGPQQGICVWPLLLVCGSTGHTLHLTGAGER